MTSARILCVFAVLFLAACTGYVEVPPVTISPQANVAPMKGKYVGMIQTGGWSLETKSSGYVCSGWSFMTDLNKSYAEAMKTAITQSVEAVDFIEETLSPAVMKEKGYAAQIVVYQGNASSSFGAIPGFFTATGQGSIGLNANIAVTDNVGLVNQYAVSSNGAGTYDGVVGCESIGNAISTAGQEAIKNLAQNSVMFIRDGLRDQESLKRADKK